MTNPSIRRPAVLALTAIALLAAGCGTKPEKPSRPDCTFRGTDEVAPNWICQPAPPEGYELVALGTWENSVAGFNFMQSQAAAAGRAELAAQMRAQILSKVESYAKEIKVDAGKASARVAETTTRQSVNELLQGAKIIRTANTKGGDLWVQVGIDKATYERTGKEALKAALNKDPALLKELQNAKADAVRAQSQLGGSSGDANSRGTSRDDIISDIMKVGS